MDVIEDVASSKGWKLFMYKSVSDNPDDANLAYCLVENQKNEFVTYLFNKEFKGFYQGHYFKDLKVAIEDYNKRLSD
jgi:hypothetical protein